MVLSSDVDLADLRSSSGHETADCRTSAFPSTIAAGQVVRCATRLTLKTALLPNGSGQGPRRAYPPAAKSARSALGLRSRNCTGSLASRERCRSPDCSLVQSGRVGDLTQAVVEEV